MARRWRVPLLVAVVATAVVAGGLTLANLRPWQGDRNEDDAVPVRDLGDGGAALPSFDDGPGVQQYRIVYLVTAAGEAGTETTVSSTEVLTVERPFASRVETWSGRPPGLVLLGVEASTFGLQQTGGPNRSSSSVEVVPGPAANDVRAAAVLAAAIERGDADVVGAREIGGRRCTVVRTGASLRAGPIVAGDDDNHTDSCVDRTGLVLEERAVSDGQLRARRLAVEVDTGPAAVRGIEFTVGDAEPVAVRQGGGSVQRLTADSRPPGRFYETATPPANFAHHGRFAAVPPQPNFATPGQEASRQAGVADVWTRGPDVVVLYQGSTSGGADPFAGEADVVEGLGGISVDDVVLTGHGSELRIRTARGAFARLAGTVPPDALVAVARGLRQVEGGTLTTVAD